MSRPRPKKSRSKSASRLEAVTAAIAGLTPRCNAGIVELPNGPLILMVCSAAAGCPRCDDARRRQRSPDVRPASKPTPSADTATSPKDVDGRIE
jgi:hypothetical protein